MKSVVLFDLDGTLLNTLPSIQKSLNRTLESEGFEPISSEKVRQLVGKSSRYLVNGALKEVGAANLPDVKKEQILDAYNADYLAHPFEGTTPYPGIPELLDRLREEGASLLVFSNKPDAIAKQVVSHFFGDRFDGVRGFREDTPRKPDPTGVFRLLDEREQSADSVIYVGDSEVDAETGANAGLSTWIVTYGFRSAAELREVKAERFLSDVEELSDALTETLSESGA